MERKVVKKHMISNSINPSWKIGIVASSFYKEEMDALVSSAIGTLQAAGIMNENVQVHEVAGSFEVPLIGAALAENKKYDALIGLGIIVEGQTHHARLLADATTSGIMDVQLRYHIPFAFEILYLDSIELARARLQKGEEAAKSVLHSLAVLRSIRT